MRYILALILLATYIALPSFGHTVSSRQNTAGEEISATGILVKCKCSPHSGAVAMKVNGKNELFVFNDRLTKFSGFSLSKGKYNNNAWKRGAEWRMTYTVGDEGVNWLTSITFTGRIRKT